MTDSILDDATAKGSALDGAIRRLREEGVALPTFEELADPTRIPEAVRHRLAAVDPDALHPLNLYRVHWWNDAARRDLAPVPGHVVLPESLTGVPAPIIVALGNRFPLIRAHKVLAAYACLVPRIVTGRFDPTCQRAIWPSTGNYCRGGVAISRLLGCRGVAVLPTGMSEERFRWLEGRVTHPEDVIRTVGTESNVKEIFDRCEELARDPANVVLNQFAEYGNHLAHVACTGPALGAIFEAARAKLPHLELAAFVSATGSAGTIGAGDVLKERFGARIVAVEPLECPTLLENGFGEHNIQGIGDKHVPLIHNVMNTDVVVAVSDRATDRLGVLFAHEAGRAWLRAERGVNDDVIDALDAFGLSSIGNIVAAVKLARRLGLGPHQAILTVATDGAEMYASERTRVLARDYAAGFDRTRAADTYERWLLGAGTDHTRVLLDDERRRIFNLGYFTWVEQRDVPIGAFEARRDQEFWRGLRGALPQWDERIREFNGRTGVLRHR